MRSTAPRNPDEHWSREALAMGLGLSTMGLSLIGSQVVKRPEIAVLGAVAAVTFAALAWPRGERR